MKDKYAAFEGNTPTFSCIKQDDCCGCEVCTNVCPINIISMKPNQEGFIIPHIDKDKCCKCNRCVDVCPVINNKCNIDLSLDAYAGYATNKELVFQSSSGGFYSLIADSFMKQKASKTYLVGVQWSDDFKYTYHVCSSSIDDLEKFKKSKYIQSKKGDVFRKVEQLLKSLNQVLYVGLPCEVVALMNYLKVEYKNLYTIDLVCQGPTSPRVMEEFVDKLEAKYNSKIQSVNMRYVEAIPWIPQWINIQFENKKIYKKVFYETEVGRAVHIMQRRSCYNCKFVGSNRRSDITLGDFHGADKNAKYYNPYGTSIVIFNTEKGKRIFDLIDSKNYILQKVSYDEVAKPNPRLVKSWEPSPLREEFVMNFRNKGLFRAASASWSGKEKLRHAIPYKWRGHIFYIFRPILKLKKRILQ